MIFDACYIVISITRDNRRTSQPYVCVNESKIEPFLLSTVCYVASVSQLVVSSATLIS